LIACSAALHDALLPGAVLAAKDADVVQARRSALAYGIDCRSLSWREGMPQHLKVWNTHRKAYQCHNFSRR
jgi:hypothetical protein